MQLQDWMDYSKWHFEHFSCGLCALTMIEVLHWTFARKTSSFSACYPRILPNQMWRLIVIKCTPRAVTCVATETHKNLPKPQVHSGYCKLNCHAWAPLANAWPSWNVSKPFILDMDATSTRFSAMLSQLGDDGTDHVVAYGSRSLTNPRGSTVWHGKSYWWWWSCDSTSGPNFRGASSSWRPAIVLWLSWAMLGNRKGERHDGWRSYKSLTSLSSPVQVRCILMPMLCPECPPVSVVERPMTPQ